MRKILLYSKATDITGKALAELLDAEAYDECPTDLKNSIIICWGYGGTIEAPTNNIINSPSKTKCARDKVLALQLLKEAGLPTPTFTTSKNIAEICYLGFPLLARKNKHKGGQDIEVVMSPLHLAKIYNNFDIFLRYISIEQEYRIHIIDHKVVAAQCKSKQEAATDMWINNIKEKFLAFQGVTDNIEDIEPIVTNVLEYLTKKKFIKIPDPLIRAHQRGWFFRQVEELPEKITDIALRAVAVLNLDIAAVDICIEESTNNIYVLELNTGPGLKGDLLTIYRNAIMGLIAKYGG